MEKKRVYIADVHMNAGKGFKKTHKGYAYEWLDPDEADRFAKFLEYLNAPNTVGEVVILGDLMDDWVYPHDKEPPSLQDIVDAPVNRKIVKALKALSKEPRIRVVYLPGNHDMGVTADFVKDNFDGMVFGGTAARSSVYRTSRLRAEHGSAHAMFNAPDPINGSVSKLPLGYFISRVVATKARNTGDAKRHYWSYADDLLEMLGPQRLAASVFEAVLEEAGLDETAEIVMPSRNGQVKSGSADKGGRAKKKTTKKTKNENVITAKEVKEKYACLYDQWKETKGKGIAFKAIMAEMGLLNRMADYLCKQSDTNIVVFGHSHDCDLDKDSWFVEDRIYANCGTWCDGEKPCTWVESEKDRSKNRHIVRVMDWNNGAPKPWKDEVSVPL